MQAIILAGGFGTRLRHVVADVPKPLAPVAGRPFLAWLLDYMARQGITDVTLSIHHQADVIQKALGMRHGPISLRYLIEPEPLGTGGAVAYALPQVKQDEPVLVLNGDSLLMLDYKAMFALHEKGKKPVTLSTMEVSSTVRYSKLTIQNDIITDYALLGDDNPGEISAGMYVMQPDLFEPYDMPKAFSLERDFFAKYIPQIRPPAYRQLDYFIDIGVPSDYERAQTEIPERVAA